MVDAVKPLIEMLPSVPPQVVGSLPMTVYVGIVFTTTCTAVPPLFKFSKSKQNVPPLSSSSLLICAIVIGDKAAKYAVTEVGVFALS